MKTLITLLIISIFSSLSFAASHCGLPLNYRYDNSQSIGSKVVNISWSEPQGSCLNLGYLTRGQTITDCQEVVGSRGGTCFQITDYKSLVSIVAHSEIRNLKLCWVCTK